MWNWGEKAFDWFQNNQPNRETCFSASFCNTSQNENVSKWKWEEFKQKLIFKHFSLDLKREGRQLLCEENAAFILLSVFEGEDLCSIYHTGGIYCPKLSTTEKIILTWYIEVMSRQRALKCSRGNSEWEPVMTNRAFEVTNRSKHVKTEDLIK